jgi:BirA family biotin operon repressor/biotin-[acetyl-CoA-carboxylase] ligase
MLSPWDSLVCRVQTGGRGRLRRSWHSFEGNVHAAWVWPGPAGEWDAAAQVLAGWGVCQALRNLGVDVSLKWPNDLLVKDAKAGGILLEDRAGDLMVGVGLNLARAPGPESMRRGHALAAGVLDVGFEGGRTGPLRLWTRIQAGAGILIRDALQGTPREFAARASRVLAWQGRQVKVVTSAGVVKGRLDGLAPDGSLVLGRAGGQERLYAGSIMLL